MNAQQQKQIRIQLNAVKRLLKEKSMYQKELEEYQEKIDKSGYEPGSSDMKRLVNLHTETEQALLDVEKSIGDFKLRLANAIKEAKEQFPDDPLIVESVSLLK